MAEDECRVFCEGEFDHGGWDPDFISAIGSKRCIYVALSD